MKHKQRFGGKSKRCFGLVFALLAGISLQEVTSSAQATSPSKLDLTDERSQCHNSLKSLRRADDSYLAGARLFAKGKFSVAQLAFSKAASLCPENSLYASALELSKQHRVDPSNRPLPVGGWNLFHETSPSHVSFSDEVKSESLPGTNADVLPGSGEPRRAAPVLPGPVHLEVHAELVDLHLKGSRRDVIAQTLKSFGIAAVFDDSVEDAQVGLDLTQCNYAEASKALQLVTGTFTIPLDSATVLVAKDSPTMRSSLEPIAYETVVLPESSPEKIKDAITLAKGLLEIKQVTAAGGAAIAVRAPQDTLLALNQTLSNLFDDSSDVLLDVTLTETNRTRTRTIGLQLPQQATIFNVDAEAAKLISNNQAVVNAAISAGLVKSGDTMGILELLVEDGLADSSVTQFAGYFGNGISMTGLSFGTSTFNLALNSSASRMLDQIQMRMKDRESGTFHVGERYPVTTSTYTVSSSTTVDGVSVSSLTAAQRAALGISSTSSSTTVPQIEYQDLGVVLAVTPTIEMGGNVLLHLNLKIRSLSGSSLNGIPIMNNREFAGDVTLGAGETAVMTSSVTNQESGTISGTPTLSEVPGFGSAVSSKDKERDTQQVFLFLTPHIVRQHRTSLVGPMIPLALRLTNPE